MSKRISKEEAKRKYENYLKLKEMQVKGIRLPRSKRQKKHEKMKNKQDGYLYRIKNRIKKTGGEIPEHLIKIGSE